jgi:hypothetical protein
MLLVGFPGLSFYIRYTRSNRDVLISVSRVRVKALCADESQDGAAQGLDGDFGWNFDKNIFLPHIGVDQIPSGEWNIGIKVSGILIDDNVAPSSIEVSGSHGKNRAAILLLADIYMFLGPLWKKARMETGDLRVATLSRGIMLGVGAIWTVDFW